MDHRRETLVIACTLLIILSIVGTFSQTPSRSINVENDQPAYRDYFYVGGEYVPDAHSNQTFMTGQMYVEHLTPTCGVSQPYPLVLIHGKGMTGACWLNTPDGRPGWASYFLEQGYEIYIVDHPARGRSTWVPTIDPAVRTYPPEVIEQSSTAAALYKLWPQAILHTQWPGENSTTKGRKGDPIFDAFYASNVEFMLNETISQLKMQKAGAALLDRIGAAVLLTHSQSGSFGWSIADVRPKLVKAIVAIEPSGPPFKNGVFNTGSSRPWGVTDIPITYSPATNSVLDLVTVEVPSTRENLISCILQKAPPRILINLVNMAILIETSQSSYHAAYEHCTVDFLRQAGLKVDFIRLEDVGIYGNGHLQMMEKNNLQIAALLHRWLAQKLKT